MRSTQDIDIILEDDATRFSQLLNLFQKHEFEISEKQFFLGYQEKTNISIFDLKSRIRLDIKIANKAFEIDVLNNAILDEILGNNLYFAPLEYVLIGKLLYIGNINDIPDSELFEYRDIFDFLTLYHANRETIDEDFLTHKAQEMGLSSTLNRLKSIEL